MRCWNCGAEQRWQCRKCGSFEQRKGRKECAECHRRASRAQYARKRHDDFEITPAVRAYLHAFDTYLKAIKAGDGSAVKASETARQAALERLMN